MLSLFTTMNDVAIHGIAPFRKLRRIVGDYSSYRARQTVVDGVSNDWLANLQSVGYSNVSYDEQSMLELISVATKIHESAEIQKRSTGKSFFRQLLDDELLKNNPIFMKFALDPEICRGLVTSLGAVPYLESIELLLTLPDTGPILQSQFYHYDYVDTWAIKQFIYIYEVDAASGPFTILPRSISDKTPFFLPHYVSDDQMARYHQQKEPVELLGSAGSRLMIDVRNCYHYGSRATKPRLAFVAYYNTGFGYYPRVRSWKAGFAEQLELNQLQRQFLDI